MSNVLTEIKGVGQPYIDEAVYVEISKAKALSMMLNEGMPRQPAFVFGQEQEPEFQGPPKPLAILKTQRIVRAHAQMYEGGYAHRINPLIQDFSHYDRVTLRWMKPGPDGKLIPR